MILTTPLIHLMKEQYPDWNISILSSLSNYPIVKYSKDINKILIFRKNIFRLFFLVIKFRIENYDIWIDGKLEYSRTSALLLKFANPKKSYGYNTGKRLFDNDLIQYKQGNHYIDLNLSALRCLNGFNYNLTNIRPIIDLPTDYPVKNINVPENKFIVILNISAGQESRIWQKEKWVYLMNAINQESDCYFIIHSMFREKEITDYIESNYQKNNFKCYNYRTIDLIGYISIIKSSNLIITPDTAAIHCASAFNIPVIGLYPDVKWNYERFTPLSSKRIVVFSKNADNVFDIEPEEVYKKYQEIMKL